MHFNIQPEDVEPEPVPTHPMLADKTIENNNCIKTLTILVKLLRVVLDPAVVSFIHYSIVICIWITFISRSVFVSVMLIRIWTVRAVVQGIWDSILVLVIVCVANVAKGVLVPVRLIRVAHIGAIVTSVPKPVAIHVLLVEVCNQWTVVPLIQNSIVILVRVAIISQSIFVCVLLIKVG